MTTINGTNGSEWLWTYSAAADIINGFGGDDSLKGAGGADRLDGGEGVDIAVYSDSSTGVFVSLYEGRGHWGSAEGDVLIGIENLAGSLSDDVLVGDGGVNMLYGSNGNDALKGGGGADILNGDLGDDTYYVDQAGDTILEKVGDGHDTVWTLASYTLAAGVEVESLLAEEAIGPVNLTGNEFNNFLGGNGGDNVLDGRGGADTLFGNYGNDTLLVDHAGDRAEEGVGEGLDTVIATVSFSLAATPMSEIERLQTGNAAGTASINLTGNDVGQTITGNNGHNVLAGLGGQDALIAHDGDDILLGGAGADMLDGGLGFDYASYETAMAPLQVNLAAGGGLNNDAQGDVLTGIEGVIGSGFADVITGNAGGNVLDGRGGADTLVGGDGGDIFLFRPVQSNGDTVVDFAGAGVPGGDVLQFTGYGAGATFTQVDAAHWQVNYNGNAMHDVITFQNAPAFAAGDFVFV